MVKVIQPKKPTVRFEGYDYIRVFFCFAIVAWHTKALGVTELFKSDKLPSYTSSLIDIAYCNIFLIGVPIFMLMSLFLYIHNSTFKKGYFLTRFRQLLILYFFWVLLFQALFVGAGSIQDLLSLTTLVPGKGHLYFLSCLLILTVCSEVLIQLGRVVSRKTFLIINCVLLTISLGMIVLELPLAAYFANNKHLNLLMGFYSPINFLPYVFLSFILYDFYKSPSFKSERTFIILCTCLLLALAVAIPLEWIYLLSPLTYTYNGMLIAPYARLSVVISTVLILIVFTKKTLHPPKWLVRMADLSMGIYLIHYFLLGISKCGLFVVFPELKPLESIYPLYFLIVLLVSMIMSYILKREKGVIG